MIKLMNSTDSFSNRLDLTKKRIRATEDRSFEIIQLEEKNRKKIIKNRKEGASLVAQW